MFAIIPGRDEHHKPRQVCTACGLAGSLKVVTDNNIGVHGTHVGKAFDILDGRGMGFVTDDSDGTGGSDVASRAQSALLRAPSVRAIAKPHLQPDEVPADANEVAVEVDEAPATTTATGLTKLELIQAMCKGHTASAAKENMTVE